MNKNEFEKRFREAIEAGKSRNYNKAIEILLSLSALSDAPEIQLFLGRAFHASGEFGKAVVALRSYIELEPDDVRGWFFLGRAYMAVSHYKQAYICFKKCCEHDQNNPLFLSHLGFAELKLKHITNAVAHLEQAHIADPDNEYIFRGYRNSLYVQALRLINSGEYELANQMLSFVISNGGTAVSSYLYRAFTWKNLGDITNALSDIETALTYAPDDPDILFQKAMLLMQHQRIDEAFALLDKLKITMPEFKGVELTDTILTIWQASQSLLQGNPKTALQLILPLIRRGEHHALLHTLAAQANLELKRYEKAINHFHRAIELDPDAIDLRISLAMTYLEIEDYENAKHIVQGAKARGAKPEDTEFIDVLCITQGPYDPVLMLPVVQRLLHQKPDNIHLMFVYGECLYKTERPEMAGPWFEKIISINPHHEKAYLYRIAVAESLSDKKGIETWYESYLSVYPDNFKLRKEFAQHLARNKKWKIAAKTLEDGFTYTNPSEGTIAFLAFCLRKAKLYKDAAIYYRNLLISQPDNEDFLCSLAYCLEKMRASKLAIELLEKGARYLKNRPRPYLMMGKLYLMNNALEKASDAFYKAHALDSKNPEPLLALAKLHKKSGSTELAAQFLEKARLLKHT